GVCWKGGRSSTLPIPPADTELNLPVVAGAAALEAAAGVAVGCDRAGEAIEVPLEQQLVLLALAARGIVGLAGKRSRRLHGAARLDGRDAISGRLAERHILRRVERTA